MWIACVPMPCELCVEYRKTYPLHFNSSVRASISLFIGC